MDSVVNPWCACAARVTVVSFPDPHVLPHEKRVWYITSGFLVVLS